MEDEKMKIVKLLRFKKLLEENNIFDFNIESFESRVAFQKLVYLAQELFGMKFDYSFNLYLRGPYSPSLADDYYRLCEIEEDKTIEINDEEKEKFEKFRYFIKSKKVEDWELIATIHYVWENNKHLLSKPMWLPRLTEEKLTDMVVKKVADLKEVDENRVRKILEEIKKISSQRHL